MLYIDVYICMYVCVASNGAMKPLSLLYRMVLHQRMQMKVVGGPIGAMVVEIWPTEETSKVGGSKDAQCNHNHTTKQPKYATLYTYMCVYVCI